MARSAGACGSWRTQWQRGRRAAALCRASRRCAWARASRGCRAPPARRSHRPPPDTPARRSVRSTEAQHRPGLRDHARSPIGCTALSSIHSSNSAPATATARASSKRRVGPASVTSSVAAARTLPTSAFASRCANGSIGPATGTPLDWYPQRPRSCTVVCRPGESTSNLPAHDDCSCSTRIRSNSSRPIDRKRTRVASLQQRRLRSLQRYHLQRRPSDDVPAARRLARVDAGLLPGDTPPTQPAPAARGRAARCRDARHRRCRGTRTRARNRA